MDNILRLLGNIEQYKDFVNYNAIAESITCELDIAIDKHNTFVQNNKYADATSILTHNLEGTNCYLLMLSSEIRSMIIYYLDEVSKILYYVSLISKGNDEENRFFKGVKHRSIYYFDDKYLVHKTNKHAVYHYTINNHTIIYSTCLKTSSMVHGVGLYLNEQLISGELYIDYVNKISIIGKNSFLFVKIYRDGTFTIEVSKVYLKTKKEFIAEKSGNKYDTTKQYLIVDAIHEYKLWESTIKN